MKKALSQLILGFFLLNMSLQGYEPYHAIVTVDTTSAEVSAPNLVDLNRDLKGPNIQALIPFYTPTSPVSIDFNIRGIEALTFFAANSTDLVVVVPQTGGTQVFSGGTRNESITLFKDYIRDAGSHGNFLKAYAKYSPIDPIAGNPNSLLASMAQADYLTGRLSPFSGCDPCWSAQPIVHQYQSGLYSGRAFSKQFDTTSVTMPLRYSYSPDLNWAFVIDAPFTYIRNGGASSVFSSLGTALRIPITHDWALTSTFRFGAGGTLDLCTSGSFLSAGLMSVYNYKINNFVVSMTNYAGYYTSINLWLTGINFNYHLHNYIFKNGLALTSCEGYTFCGLPLNFNLSFIDSYFAKDRLYIDHYDEVGVSLITTHINPYLNYDCASLGFAYQFANKKFKGYYLNLAYQF